MKKRRIAAGLLASLIAINPSMLEAEDCCMPEYRPGDILCDDEACVIYSAYAGTQLNCGWDVYGWGEFLYLRPWRSTSWVALEIPAFQDIPTTPQRNLPHRFGYRPAFSVGLGLVLHNFDDWMLNIDYLWFHHSFKKTMTVVSPVSVASTLGNLIAPFIYNAVINKSKIHYDIIGVDIQRPNYLGQRVILSPFLGLKWLTRNFKISQDFIQAGSGLIDRDATTIKWSSIGINAGFDGKWLLCWGLSLIGKADVALLYPYDRDKLIDVTTFADGVVNSNKTPIRHLDMFARGGMGIGWGSYFCCNRYHLDLAATYDFMGEIPKVDFESGQYQNSSHLLMGLALRCQFDF